MQAMGRRRRLVATLLAAAALVPSAAAAADWPTYHGDNTRQGNDTADPGLSSAVDNWTSAALDGAVYGSPAIVGSQVIVATENDTVYSLDPSDGAVQWSRHVGTPRTSNFPCGNINPLGITGTPVVTGGTVFVAAEVQANPTTFHFDLVSLSLATGAVTRVATLDPPDARFSANVEQQRGALLVTDGKVFVPLGGLDGDCGSYHGYVLAYPVTGSAPVQWWADTEVDSSNREGGIWATGGLSADASGYVYASTGNSNHTTSTSAYDDSDGVIKLDPGTVRPVDYFAPANWYQDNAGDVDLGSTTTVQLPNNQAFIVGKSGNGYLLSTASLGHIGGQLAIHRVCHATNSAAFGSLAYAGGTVYVGCSDGVAAVTVSGNNFSARWYNTTSVADRPPTIAGNVVWAISSSGSSLLGFDPSTGEALHSFGIGSSSHFSTPSAANGHLYVGANTHVRAFGTLPEPAVNGVTLDGFGGIHHFGSVASNTQGAPSWPGWQIARSLVVLPDHSGGYVLDGWGGLHHFGAAPTLADTSYWKGWDIARALVVGSDGLGGYVLDGWGGIHPVGNAPDVRGTGYWPGWDIAVGIVLRSDNRSGWVLDGWGGLHPFAAAGTAMPPTVPGPYWRGWNIARGVSLSGDGGGYVLDGWGGVHPFGNAASVATHEYYKGSDVARAISIYSTAPVSGYWLDAFGGLHTVGGAAGVAAPAYLFGQYIFRGFGVTR
jgi:polyvinyl alcohol dehydrogenase (cytochrome)